MEAGSAIVEAVTPRPLCYCFDIDGTLCSNTDGSYEAAVPFPDMVARVNRLYDQGHRIILLTARGSTTGIDWRPLTERQMAEWGVRYHSLHLGKPTADVYIDDRAINANQWRAEPRPETLLTQVSARPDAARSDMAGPDYTLDPNAAGMR